MVDIFGIKFARFYRSFRGERLTLRRSRLRDMLVLFSLFTPEVLWQTNRVKSRDFRSLWSFYRWIKTTFQICYVILTEEEPERRILGFVGFYDIDIGRQLWLSLAIFNPADRRQGYGSQALALVLHSLQKSMEVKAVCVEIHETNTPSLRLCAKLGFVVRRYSRGRVFLSARL